MREKKIIVPLDFSELSENLVAYAIGYAKALSASIVLVHTIPSAQLGEILGNPETGAPMVVDPGMITQLKNSSQEQLDKFQNQVRAAGIECRTAILTGTPFQEIVSFAEAEHADLIIIGSHGRSKLKHFLLGSVAEKVAHKSPLPVLIFKPKPKD